MRVAIVDDHPIVRDGLAAILGDEDDLEVVGAFASGEELLERASGDFADVVLIDLELPGLDGVETIQRLRQVDPSAKVIVFSAYGAAEKVYAAVKSGAQGYVLKGAPAAEITGSVRAVANGGSHIDARIAASVLALGGRTGERLSQREREVLVLVSQGRSNKQIAQRLSISERTAKYHVSSIMRKLGADNRAQAIAVASRRGLL